MWSWVHLAGGWPIEWQEWHMYHERLVIDCAQVEVTVEAPKGWRVTRSNRVEDRLPGVLRPASARTGDPRRL